MKKSVIICLVVILILVAGGVIVWRKVKDNTISPIMDKIQNYIKALKIFIISDNMTVKILNQLLKKWAKEIA